MAENNDQLLGVDMTPNSTQNDGNQDPDYHGLLVGEGKKYSDDAALAKGYGNIAAHAKTVEDENAEMRKQLATMQTQNKTVDDILAQINKPPAGDHHMDVNEDQPVSKEDIAALIAAGFDQRDKATEVTREADKIKTNQKSFWAKATELYGDLDKAKTAVSMYVGDDVSKRDMVKNLGSYDPTTLVTILTNAVAPKGEQINFGGADLGANNSGETVVIPQGLMTYAQAEVVRKKDPKLYKSRAFQNKLHASAAKLDNFWVGTNRK